MNKVFVDTNVFVAVLNKESGFENSSNFLEEILRKKIMAFISVATISELLSIYYKISEKEAILAKTYIESLFGEENIVPVIKEIAETTGKIKALYKLSLGDALIVASAIALKCDFLVSLDSDLKRLDLIKVKEPKDVN